MINPHSTPLHVHRPWGNFFQYTQNQSTTVKIIEIDAGGVLSLQKHAQRDEVWIPLDDGILAEINGEKICAKVGEMLFVPRETMHRLSAAKKARVLEIAFGHFDEDDIVRLEDAYGRK